MNRIIMAHDLGRGVCVFYQQARQQVPLYGLFARRRLGLDEMHARSATGASPRRVGGNVSRRNRNSHTASRF